MSITKPRPRRMRSAATEPGPTRSAAIPLVRADRVGMAGSLLCAVHCALTPLVIALLPALGLGVLGSIDIDQSFAVFAALLGITTLSLGFRRHRAFHGWALLLPGLALLGLGSFTTLHDHSGLHAAVMVCGGLLIAAAHFANLRLSHVAARTVVADQ